LDVDLVPPSDRRGIRPSPPVQRVLLLVVLLHLGDKTTGGHEFLVRVVGLRLALAGRWSLYGAQSRRGSPCSDPNLGSGEILVEQLNVLGDGPRSVILLPLANIPLVGSDQHPLSRTRGRPTYLEQRPDRMPPDNGGKIRLLESGPNAEVPLDQLEVPIQRFLSGGQHVMDMEARREERYGRSASTVPGNYRAHVGAWGRARTTGATSQNTRGPSLLRRGSAPRGGGTVTIRYQS